jgi:hypothetical protein
VSAGQLSGAFSTDKAVASVNASPSGPERRLLHAAVIRGRHAGPVFRELISPAPIAGIGAQLPSIRLAPHLRAADLERRGDRIRQRSATTTAGCKRHGVERRLAQADREPRSDDPDLRERKLVGSTHEISHRYQGTYRAELDERKHVCGVHVLQLQSEMPLQQVLEPLVRNATGIVTDGAARMQIGAAQDDIGGPVLKKDHQLRIDVASTPRVRRYEVALVPALAVVADALVVRPSALPPETGELQQASVLVHHDPQSLAQRPAAPFSRASGFPEIAHRAFVSR